MGNPYWHAIDMEKVLVRYVRVHFPVSGLEVPVPHNLGIIAMGGAVVGVDKHCTIKDGQTPPGSNVLYMVSDTDGVTATIRVEAVTVTERREA